ncbi:hypothetical protein DEO72_LG9g1483 [Vigna unguiculata]|uniref:Uncharacterized protein n=1 Tax=Vigna unguiculata TaxID=3917 RepID=A0A4D6N0T9_VIGUN|nr:hypothetical protein DEO72_LG9g1483 [Vigna unguiculata]
MSLNPFPGRLGENNEPETKVRLCNSRLGEMDPLGLDFFRDGIVAKLCEFRPSDSFSPRRELQESIQCSYSSNSLRRLGLGLSEIQSRLGEIGSPRQGECLSPERETMSLNPFPGRLGENNEPETKVRLCNSRLGEMDPLGLDL